MDEVVKVMAICGFAYGILSIIIGTVALSNTYILKHHIEELEKKNKRDKGQENTTK